jgi:hypothetical protein
MSRTLIGDELRDLINQRLTLNLLIQGSAQHAFLTSHYLVRDELNAIDSALLPLYDKLALAGFVQYWCDYVIVAGWPPRFWRRAARKKRHPFYHHPLLSRHGGMLAQSARQRAVERCREKGVTRIFGLHSLQLTWLVGRIRVKERGHLPALIELAKRTTQMVWGISPEQLDGAITRQVAFGELSWPKTYTAMMQRVGAAGFGGVLRDGEKLKVVAKAWVWPLLSHELVKGTVELICMHGLSGWDDATYAAVMKAADRIEHEPWMLQAGSELWRRLLPLLPDDRPLAQVIMHLARLPAQSLESLMLAVIEQPDWAKEMLAALGAGDDEELTDFE